MKKTTSLAIFFLIFCSFFVYGADFYFKKNEIIDLKIGCYKDGANCDDTIGCNLTSIYPNSSIFIDDELMTRNPSYYSYTLAGTNMTGVYSNMMVCTDNVTSTYTLFNFEVNNKGNNEQPSFMNALLILIPLILGIICIFATFSLGDDHPILKILLLLFSLTTFFMSISIAMINIGYYNTFNELIDTLGLWIYLFGTIYFLIIVYFILYAIAKLMSMFSKDKEQRLNY